MNNIADSSMDNLNMKWDEFLSEIKLKDVFIRTVLSKMEHLQRVAERLHSDCKSGEVLLLDIKHNMTVVSLERKGKYI